MKKILRYILKTLFWIVLLYILLCTIFIFKAAYTNHDCLLTYPNTPKKWKSEFKSPEFNINNTTVTLSYDQEKWYIPNYKTVKFPSRAKDTTIEGWYIEVDPKAPVVIVSHGIRPNCKAASEPLMLSAMLAKSNINVLSIDLQNYGNSSHNSNFIRYGQTEYLDILGAYDWLKNKKHYNSNQIGIAGISLGAVTSAIAFSKEPGIKALWLDSPFIDFDSMINYELNKNNLPSFFKYGVIVLADIFIGIKLNEHKTQDAIENANNRSIFITHGTNDTRIPFTQAKKFLEIAKEHNVHIENWFVDGAEHLDALFTFPYTYQHKMANFFLKNLKHY